MLIFVFCVIFSLNGFSDELDGIPRIPAGIKSFFDPLTKGAKHIDEALAVIPSLNDSGRQFAESQVNDGGSPNLSSQLRKIMVMDQQGKVVSYKESDSRTVLNGAYVVKTYVVRFMGGKSRTLQFKFVKPTISGNFQFVDAALVD